MPRGQCLAAKSVEPLLSQMFWVRGTGTHLLSMGMVTLSAAQQGVLTCQPDHVQREEKLPRDRGAWSGVNTFTLHLEDTAGPPSWITKEDLAGNVAAGS